MDYDQGSVRIVLGDTVLMEGGQPLEFDAKVASAYLKAAAAAHGTVAIQVAIGAGPGRGKAWGCDLSYDYVKVRKGRRKKAGDGAAWERRPAAGPPEAWGLLHRAAPADSPPPPLGRR